RELDGGAQVPLADSGLIKTLVMRQAVDIVQEALALTSNHGLSRRNPLERHLRDVLCGRIHTPQEDSALVLAGRAVLEQA
ncbi:MAG: acyl-CoA dehydrogenase family protein, partial [Comamonas sp.]